MNNTWSAITSILIVGIISVAVVVLALHIFERQNIDQKMREETARVCIESGGSWVRAPGAHQCIKE